MNIGPRSVEQALVKLLSRGDRSIQSVADDLNVNYHTLKNWMKRKAQGNRSELENKEKRPQDWRAEEQLVALHETHGLSGEALHAWCRERGLSRIIWRAGPPRFVWTGKA